MCTGGVTGVDSRLLIVCIDLLVCMFCCRLVCLGGGMFWFALVCRCDVEVYCELIMVSACCCWVRVGDIVSGGAVAFYDAAVAVEWGCSVLSLIWCGDDGGVLVLLLDCFSLLFGPCECFWLVWLLWSVHAADVWFLMLLLLFLSSFSMVCFVAAAMVCSFACVFAGCGTWSFVVLADYGFLMGSVDC